MNLFLHRQDIIDLTPDAFGAIAFAGFEYLVAHPHPNRMSADKLKEILDTGHVSFIMKGNFAQIEIGRRWNDCPYFNHTQESFLEFRNDLLANHIEAEKERIKFFATSALLRIKNIPRLYPVPVAEVMTSPHVHEFYLAILEYSQQWKEGRIQLPEYWDQAFADIKEAKEAEASLVELARNPLGNSEGSQAEQYNESKVPSDKDWEK